MEETKVTSENEAADDSLESISEEITDSVQVQTQEQTDLQSNKNRYKIDKLMGLRDLKYRGIFSGRAMKILGFVLMFCAQIYLCINLVNKIGGVKPTTLNFANALDILSVFALPMFLAANFCVIMTSKTKIKKTIITYTVIAIAIYLLIIFIFYRYVMSIGQLFNPDDPAAAYALADTIAKKLFGKVINYNVFVDLSLFSLFYYFLFYTPKKMVKKGSIIAFRILCIIPILFAVIATLLYGFYNESIIDLPVAVLAIMPCRSLGVYVIFFGIAFVVKLRQYLFVKWGGTPQEYDTYAKSNRSSLEISVVSAIIIIVVSLIDFALLYINPWLMYYGIGVNFYLAFAAPFILLLSYTKKTKPNMWDFIMVVIFIFAVIILYLETGRYIILN